VARAALRAFSGKVVTGFPPENATAQKRAFSGKVVTGFPPESATTQKRVLPEDGMGAGAITPL
jgi:hypothetical protein